VKCTEIDTTKWLRKKREDGKKKNPVNCKNCRKEEKSNKKKEKKFYIEKKNILKKK